MKIIEKNLLLLASIIVIIILSFYFFNFMSFSLSDNQNDWGTFGDYVGGVLNPLLSFILIILIIKEAVESRKNFLESKQMNLKSQQQIDEQIRLLLPKPEVVYYLKHQNSRVYAILENIGNAVAYDINPTFDFKDDPDNILGDRIFRLQALNYLAPNQKAGAFIGHMNIDDTVIGLPEHKVELEFFSFVNEQRILFQRRFYIDKNILSTIVRGSDIEGAIKKVADNLKSNRKNV